LGLGFGLGFGLRLELLVEPELRHAQLREVVVHRLACRHPLVEDEAVPDSLVTQDPIENIKVSPLHVDLGEHRAAASCAPGLHQRAVKGVRLLARDQMVLSRRAVVVQGLVRLGQRT